MDWSDEGVILSVRPHGETGAVLEPAVKYQRIAQTEGLQRDNH